MSRLDQLRALLENEPDDLFLNFGLAMELFKEGRLEEALAGFYQDLGTSWAINSPYLKFYGF